MNLDRITPHMAHELAMLAVQKSHEGLPGAAVAKIYRDAFTNCDKEPEITGVGCTPPKDPGISISDPLHPDYAKNFVPNKER
jgi:hypothetical protein